MGYKRNLLIKFAKANNITLDYTFFTLNDLIEILSARGFKKEVEEILENEKLRVRNKKKRR